MDKTGYLKYDGDGHSYLIPEELKEDFDHKDSMIELQDVGSSMYYTLVEEFNDDFGGFLVEGELHTNKITIHGI